MEGRDGSNSSQRPGHPQANTVIWPAAVSSARWSRAGYRDEISNRPRKPDVSWKLSFRISGSDRVATFGTESSEKQSWPDFIRIAGELHPMPDDTGLSFQGRGGSRAIAKPTILDSPDETWAGNTGKNELSAWERVELSEPVGYPNLSRQNSAPAALGSVGNTGQ